MVKFFVFSLSFIFMKFWLMRAVMTLRDWIFVVRQKIASEWVFLCDGKFVGGIFGGIWGVV